MNIKRFAANSRVSRRPWFYPLISVVVAISLCLATPLPSKALPWFDIIRQGVQIFQLSNMSPRNEVELGKQINEQITGEVPLYRNREINSYVNQIGQRLAAKSDRTNIPYTFQVVDDDAVNAFATAGGFVYVHTGLMTAADNEAELASVIAHEIGHIGGRHLIKQMRQTAVAQGVATAAGVDRSRAVQIGMELALRRPRSRQDEFDADARGLRTLGRAGYAQSGMVSFMRKLLRSGSTPTFLSTHPATQDRISALQKAIDPQRGNVGDGLDSAAYKARIRALL
jgi:predicted Zn-dependent protease